MEIKNRQEQEGREEGDNGGKTCKKDPWTIQWGGDCIWEQGLDGAGESKGGEMRTTVTE